MPNHKCYGVNVSSWFFLANLAREQKPSDPEYQRSFSQAFIDSFKAILQIDRELLTGYAATRPDSQKLVAFMKVWDIATKNAVDALQDDLVDEALGSEDFKNFLAAVSGSGTPEELLALAKYLPAEPREEASGADLTTATVVTDSLKDLIKRYTKKKWVHTVLKAINEVIQIIRGI